MFQFQVKDMLRTLLVAGSLSVALSGRAFTTSPAKSDAGNAQMTAIYNADQADRKDVVHVNWSEVDVADDHRRKQVKDLLAAGALHSGEDFRHAAFVFQHGDGPNDYLMAHTLAMVAVRKGDEEAIWIAAATLDRYLQSIKQPQIYGTQYVSNHQGPFTQDPYNRTLVPDALRAELKVPLQADQDAERRKMEETYHPTAKPDLAKQPSH